MGLDVSAELYLGFEVTENELFTYASEFLGCEKGHKSTGKYCGECGKINSVRSVKLPTPLGQRLIDREVFISDRWSNAPGDSGYALHCLVSGYCDEHRDHFYIGGERLIKGPALRREERNYRKERLAAIEHRHNLLAAAFPERDIHLYTSLYVSC